MLIKCKECELPVSDTAVSCPHCGYNLKKKKKGKKRQRLPNGFGSITELKNRNLRNPFFVRICVGKNSEGRPILQSLKPKAYFKTYNEAYAALVEYNKDPYELSKSMTMKELYDEWTSNYFEHITATSSRTIKAAWNYSTILYDVPVKNIRARHLKGCINDSGASASTKQRMKSVFNLMFDYAVEYEIVDKNVARTFNISDDVIQESEKNQRKHMPFKDWEIDKMLENIGNPYVDVVLIQCFTGLRPQELGLIKVVNVDMQNKFFIAGMKTAAGTDRTIPIHPIIEDLFKSKYEEARSKNHTYLFEENGQLTYDKYKTRYAKVISGLGLNPEHRPHDPRNTFITMAKKYSVDEYAIKRIVGHSFKADVTEYVYTERSLDWLQSEIQKIKHRKGLQE